MSNEIIPAAAILAGSRAGTDPVAQGEGVAHKALIVLEGRTLLERVVGALRAAGVKRIVVSCDNGPVAREAERLGVETLAAAPGPSASVAALLDHVGAPLVLTTADHALLRPEWIVQLLEDSPSQADVAIMLARRDRIERALPGSQRTYLRFADGHWSGCNLFLLRTPRAARAVETWKRVEADRKRPWRIAARLGIGTLLSMALGRLTLAEGLARLGRTIGLDVALVSASDGLAAVDVDTARDLADVCRLLRESHEGPDKRAGLPTILR